MIATQLTNNEPQTWLILITIGRMLRFPQFFDDFVRARLQLNYKKKTIGLDKSAASNPQCFDACRRQALAPFSTLVADKRWTHLVPQSDLVTQEAKGPPNEQSVTRNDNGI